jgi:adenylate cyclase
VAFGSRGVRALVERARGRVRVRYPDGTTVAISPGTSLLEASRTAGIPHAAVCGGRGRCSTCRVRVGGGAGHLPPPSPGEARVLARLGLAEGVRLACQLRPARDLAVAPLLPATAGTREVLAPADPSQGAEREVAVLFADLRGFTRLAEGRLPYDTVFVLNRYFRVMGEAIEESGGHVDKFIGDGIMALFGVGTPPQLAARQALAAARAMALGLDGLNRELRGELGEPLRMGIGLHDGPVILGEMGHGRARSLTAVGDVVNVASRLEAMSKEYDAQLVVADDLALRAGVDLAGFARHEIRVRGRSQRLAVRVVPDAGALPALAPADPPAEARRRAWAGLFLLARRRAAGRHA